MLQKLDFTYHFTLSSTYSFHTPTSDAEWCNILNFAVSAFKAGSSQTMSWLMMATCCCDSHGRRMIFCNTSYLGKVKDLQHGKNLCTHTTCKHTNKIGTCTKGTQHISILGAPLATTVSRLGIRSKYLAGSVETHPQVLLKG